MSRGKGKRKINKIFDHMYHNCVKFIDTLLARSLSDYKHTLRHHHLPTEEQRVRRSEVRPTKQRKTFILDNIVQYCARREKNTRRESPSITLCERRNNWFFHFSKNPKKRRTQNRRRKIKRYEKRSGRQSRHTPVFYVTVFCYVLSLIFVVLL